MSLRAGCLHLAQFLLRLAEAVRAGKQPALGSDAHGAARLALREDEAGMQRGLEPW
jgi:histidinol phosphatase-like PHP family hydrolase